jgi:2-dehydro-3-deoxyphosphooctonate aldolase (KDO 8-P synthase)
VLIASFITCIIYICTSMSTTSTPTILHQLFGTHHNPKNFFLLAGPCVVESEQMLMDTAGHLQEVCTSLQIPLVFKSSYKKANRTSSKSFTGIGNEQALSYLAKVKQQFNIPIVTDIHTEAEASLAAQYVDVLQIPAFLCRQTDLLIAAANTGKVVNIKKGQFLNAGSMQLAAQKVIDTGNNKVMLTERGNSFGYTDLVVDFRNIPEMKTFGYPVIMDCTHAVQQPNNNSGTTGGTPQYVSTMAKCGIVAGADGLFIETHPSPHTALSDGANMLPLAQIKNLLETLCAIKQVCN